MQCPKCGYDLGDGLLPARCPNCGRSLSSQGDAHGRGGLLGRQRAAGAAAARESVEGLTGIGRGRRDASRSGRAAARFVVALALVAAFCGLVYVVAYQTELIGGRTVPDVVGWRQERAVRRLEEAGFSPQVVERPTTAQASGMVVSTSPGEGARAEVGSTITVEVASGT